MESNDEERMQKEAENGTLDLRFTSFDNLKPSGNGNTVTGSAATPARDFASKLASIEVVSLLELWTQ